MTISVEQKLLSKIRSLSPQQRSEVEDFVDFLATRRKKQDALERLLAIAPALEAAGAASISDAEIAAEIESVRRERTSRKTG
jgi:hypothetical protein